MSGSAKKKVLVTMPAMFLGGAETSLLGLLDAFDPDRFDVSLFLYRHEGELMPHIPAHVRLLPERGPYTCFERPVKRVLFSRYFHLGLTRLLAKIHLRLKCLLTGERPSTWKTMQFTARWMLPFLPLLPGRYDLALMFLGIPSLLDKKVRAKVKVAWVHTDYHTLRPDRAYDRRMYGMVDYVAHVSEACRQSFLDFYPALAGKTLVIENILPLNFVRGQALAFNPVKEMPPVSFRLLSVGRFSDAKNFDNVPDICRRLVAQGHNVVWYLIGYGAQEPLIRQRVQEAGMEDRVIILGKKDNPYPYLKACDLYVQPSRYEGKSVAVREAQMLGKPVVITRYKTASDQLEDGVDGLIVPMDNAGCAAGIAELIQNGSKREALEMACLTRDYTNSEAVTVLTGLHTGPASEENIGHDED